MSSATVGVTLLLTAHNEVDTIERVIQEFYGEVHGKISFKILVVEDGSTDGTKETLLRLNKRFPMDVLMDEKRRGYSKAVIEGLRHVDTDYVFYTDGDGQHTATDFWKLYKLKDEYDVVSGWRIKRADSFSRRLMSTVFQLLTKTLFKLPPFHDITAPYKLMRTESIKQVANEFKYMKESFWTEFTIRAYRKGFKIAEVPVSHRDRLSGSTRVYKLSKIPGIVLSHIIALLKLWRDTEPSNP